MCIKNCELYNKFIISLLFTLFSGLILSFIDAYLNLRQKTFTLFRPMSFLCILFYGIISIAIIQNYTADLPKWFLYIGYIGIVSNALALLVLIVSKYLRLILSRSTDARLSLKGHDYSASSTIY